MKVRSVGIRRIVLAVSPFTSNREAGLSDHVRQIIIHDIELSGFFQIVDLKDLDDRDLTDFQSMGQSDKNTMEATVLLEASTEFRGDNISLNARLQEQSTNQRILDKKFDSSVELLRRLGHRIADEISYYLIGDRGIASTKIAFIAVGKVSKEIAVVDYDGFGVHQITSNGSLNLSPCWSPDGKSIAFTSYVSGNPDLVVLRLMEGRMVNISKQDELHSAPAWSPDGKKIALTMTKTGNAEIYTMDTKGGKLRRLTHNPSIDSSPTWSPNGREMAFTSNRSGSPQIFIMDGDGGNVRRLTYEGSYNASPAWSPRGDLIAFVTRERSGFQIYTIDVNGENLNRLTDSLGNNENPSWSPNGMWLAFASNRTGEWDIYVIHRDGFDLRRLTHEGGNVSPSWSPRLPYNE